MPRLVNVPPGLPPQPEEGCAKEFVPEADCGPMADPMVGLSETMRGRGSVIGTNSGYNRNRVTSAVTANPQSVYAALGDLKVWADQVNQVLAQMQAETAAAHKRISELESRLGY